MSKNCSNSNEVFQYFNLMQDGRAFTDYRSQAEVYNYINKRANKFCEDNANSYDTRICLQRNASVIFNQDNNKLNNTYNLPKCVKNNNNIASTSNVVNNNVVNNN